MLKRKEYCKIVTTIVLVMCLTFASSFNLFANISFAESESLGKQDSEQMTNNIDYDVEFEKGNEEKGYEFEGTTDEEELSIHMKVEIKKEGYLKNGQILIESENGLSFEISQEQGEKYQTEENHILLSNISAGEKIDIKLPIKYKERDDIENLNKKINVKLIGTYVNKSGKEKSISQNIILKLMWKVNTEYEITSELKKYIPYKDGAIIQTNIKTLIPQGNKFVSKEKLEIEAIDIEGYKIEKVIVTEKTDELKENEWNYDNSQNKIFINLENNEKSLESKEFFVTYILSGKDEIQKPFKTTSKINGSIFMYGTEESASNEIEQEYEINEAIGNIVSIDGETTPAIKEGNILTNSLSEENNYETDFESKINIDISSTDMCEGIIIKNKTMEFENSDGRYEISNSKCKSIKVSKENFDKIFGENGKIEILNEAGEEISEINKNTKIENDEFIAEVNAEKISIKTSKPANEGIITLKLNNSIGKTDYTYENLKTFSNINVNYEGSILHNENSENKVSDIENKIELIKPETNAEMTISRNTLSTISDNKVELEIKMNNTNEDNDLYKNPRFQLTFPEYVEDVSITNIAIANSEDVFEIKNNSLSKNAEGKLVLDIETEGEQVKYNSNNITNGTSIIINCNLKLNLYTPTSKDKIELRYINENATQYKNENNNEGYNEVEVEYKAPVGVVSINKISNYSETGNTITSVNQGKATDKIEIFDEAKTATMDIIVMNNNENNCKDVKILGRTPFKGNKDVTTGKDLETTIDTKMVEEIKSDENNKANATIYYSENGEATEDLEDNNNKWTTIPENLENIKSYLIVLNDYEMQPGEILKYSYQYQIPENLEHNTNIYGSFKTIYENENNVATLKEESKADIVGLTTGQGPQLAVKTISNIQNTVKEYEKIKYTVTVENTGSESAENIVVKTEVPTGATLASHSTYSSVETTKGWSLSADREIETKIEKLNPGEIKKVEFFVQANKLPTIEEYYATEEGFTQNEDGTYSINEEYVDENGETKYKENKINGIPEIKLVCKSTVSAKELDKSIESEDAGIVVEKANLVAEETIETEESVARVNEEIESKIQIQNNSQDVMRNIKVTKVLPEGLNYNESYVRGYEDDGLTLRKIETTNYDKSTRKVTWTIDELQPGRTALVIGDWTIGNMKENTYKDTIATSSTIAVNGEEYQAGEIDITVGRPKLEVAQISNKTNEYIKVGDEIEYTFNIKNVGSARANDVTLIDKLPDEVTIKKLDYVVDGVEVSKVVAKNEDATVYTSILPEGELKAKVVAEVNDISAPQRTITNVGNVEGEDITKVDSNKVTNIIERTANNTENTETSNSSNSNSQNNKSNNETTDTKNKYEIKGTVWIDEDKNGQKDNGEAKISGIEVKLINTKTSEQIEKTATNQDGEYKFSNLDNGTYIAIFSYDSSKYGLTEYRKQGVAEDKNSDVINSQENGTTVGTTDVITIENGSKSNIDMGLIKATSFDLALTKTISKVTVQNKGGTKAYDFNNTDLAKVDINAKYLNGSTVLVEYTFTVKNEGEIEGYAKQLVDYLPEELEFNTELNKNWYKGNDGNLYTDELANTAIQAGQEKTVKLTLTKAMTETNTGIINNQAEIAKDYNKAGIADADSTPGDKDQKDDDMSSADLIIGVKTGETLIYMSAIIAGLIAVIIAVVAIKKSKLIYKIQIRFRKEV